MIIGNGAGLSFSETLKLSGETINMGGGKLPLLEGVTLESGSVLEMGSGQLFLSGNFVNEGATVTASQATLNLSGDTVLNSRIPLAFKSLDSSGNQLKVEWA